MIVFSVFGHCDKKLIIDMIKTLIKFVCSFYYFRTWIQSFKYYILYNITYFKDY